MSYFIDPSPVYDGRRWVASEKEATIVLVGCGGTGSFLAEAICRLLIGRDADLYLVDMDRVEAHNVARQSFDAADVGRFKAQVLAERLARRFDRTIGYSVLPYNRQVHAQVFRPASRLNLLVGCVDNAAARAAIAETLTACHSDVWWLDAGNGHNAGQVLLGNALRPEALRGAFIPHLGLCRALPAPSLQRPDLLDAPPAPQPALDCAEAVAHALQGPTINQIVAAVAATFVEKLLNGTCGWMAAYFDLDDGTLRCLPAEPGFVASLVGLRPNSLTQRV
ncbi:MAG: ThiF family adenylyltransferase [Anaerolineae bacterium]|nr:ThiF family adenylyltransferase [Anaerolineae bacterium]